MLGMNVGLLDGTRINASGLRRRGQVLVSGGLHGTNPSIHNAAQTHVESDVVIQADALQSGNGGKVVVWADLDTYFCCPIGARGGTLGERRHGRDVGKDSLTILGGSVSASATQGTAGTWLLDPSNVTISNTATSASETITGSAIPPSELFTPVVIATMSCGDIQAAA